MNNKVRDSKLRNVTKSLEVLKTQGYKEFTVRDLMSVYRDLTSKTLYMNNRELAGYLRYNQEFLKIKRIDKTQIIKMDESDFRIYAVWLFE